MWIRPWALAWMFLFCTANAAFSQTAAEQSAIDAAIRKLRSSSFVQREIGRKQLEAIGIPALAALRRASTSVDAEAKHRIEDLIANFEEQLQTKQILTPKNVHLKVAGVTVQQAVAELARVSGYPLQIQGDAAAFADKKITLDTGATSFWQAFDQLCAKAGLMEHVEPYAKTAQVNPYNMGRYSDTYEAGAQGPIGLVARNHAKPLISYAGAIKTEIRLSRSADTKILMLMFSISAEPRLMSAGLAAAPRLDRVADGRERPLSVVPDPPVPIAKNKYTDELALELMGLDTRERLRRDGQIRVKAFDEPGGRLKEVRGRLTLQLDLANEPLVKIDKILDAGGKSADGANGGFMKVDSVKKLANGDVEVRVMLASLTPGMGPANIILRANGLMKIRGGARFIGGGTRGDLPDLLDAKGQKFKLAEVPSQITNVINGAITRHATMVFQPNPGQGEPSGLVLFGTRTYTIAVPFQFQDLPLPGSARAD